MPTITCSVCGSKSKAMTLFDIEGDISEPCDDCLSKVDKIEDESCDVCGEFVQYPDLNLSFDERLCGDCQKLYDAESDKSFNARQIDGVIVFLYPKSEFKSGWKAGKIKTSQGTHKFSGPCQVATGDRVTLFGEWKNGPDELKYNKGQPSFHTTGSLKTIPIDLQALKNILEKDARFPGIGPVRSEKIRNYLESHNLSLDDIAAKPLVALDMRLKTGIPRKAIRALREAWETGRVSIIEKANLLEMGLSDSVASGVMSKYGSDSIAKIKENPYALIQDEVPFATADKIALQKLGWSHLDERRLSHVIDAAFESMAADGHTWGTTEQVLEASARIFDERTDPSEIQSAISPLLLSSEKVSIISMTMTSKVMTLASSKLMANETIVGKRLTSLEENKQFGSIPTEEELINEFADKDPFSGEIISKPSPAQLSALINFTKQKMSVITGAAGCGKTYTIAMIAQYATRHKLRTLMCAPTGKAAKRMSELMVRRKIDQAYAISPQTIHRAIGLKPGAAIDKDTPAAIDEADIVIMDETSMVDINLMKSVFDRAKPNTTFVFVGDHNQLPSIGPGAILRDLVVGQLCHVTELDTVFRQAGPLRSNAKTILSGKVEPTTQDPRTGDTVWYVNDTLAYPHHCIEDLKTTYSALLDPKNPHDIQVLSPSVKHETLGVHALNKELRPIYFSKVLNSNSPEGDDLTVGDRVLQTKNDYQLGIMNGDQGTIVSVDGNDMKVRIDGMPTLVTVPRVNHKLLMAYAITVHKFQGSETKTIIGLMHSMMPKPLRHQSLLYTMATRGSQRVCLLGDHALHTSARNIEPNQRRTMTMPQPMLAKILG